MFEPPPLEEHWTICPLPSQRATWPSGRRRRRRRSGRRAGSRRAAGRGRRRATRRRRLRRFRCRGSSPFAVHCCEVVRPMSMPACANAQRVNIEQSQVEPDGSRLCMSCDRAAAVGRRAEVVGEAADVRDGPGEDGARAARGAGGEGAAILVRLREDGVDVAVGVVVGEDRAAVVAGRAVGAEESRAAAAIASAGFQTSANPSPSPSVAYPRLSCRWSARRGDAPAAVPARQVEPRNCIGPVAPAVDRARRVAARRPAAGRGRTRSCRSPRGPPSRRRSVRAACW